MNDLEKTIIKNLFIHNENMQSYLNDQVCSRDGEFLNPLHSNLYYAKSLEYSNIDIFYTNDVDYSNAVTDSDIDQAIEFLKSIDCYSIWNIIFSLRITPERVKEYFHKEELK
jgi:hypothetical protein